MLLSAGIGTNLLLKNHRNPFKYILGTIVLEGHLHWLSVKSRLEPPDIIGGQFWSPDRLDPQVEENR